MHLNDVGCNCCSVFLRQFFLLQVKFSNRYECFLRPWEEPINGGVGDEAWEVSTSDTESVSGWTHCQYDVQVVFHFFQEIIPHVFFDVRNFFFDCLSSNFVSHLFLAFLVEKGWNHTDCQKVVNELQESLLNYVGIGEEEERWRLAQ